MKNNMIKLRILLLGLIVFFGSCQSSYFVDTRFGKDLSGSRTCFSSDSTFSNEDSWCLSRCESPFAVDFFSSVDTMRYQYNIDFVHLEEAKLSEIRTETVKKHFYWFVTRYDYHARYDQLQNFPVPLSRYMTPEQQQLFLRASSNPETWNGRECYLTLDDLNSKFGDWMRDCYFTVFFETMMECADASQRALFNRYRDTLQTQVLRSDFVEVDSIVKLMAAIPELKFCEKIFDESEELFEARYEDFVSLMAPLESAYIYCVHLPGHLAKTQVPSCMKDGYGYKIDGNRLLAGPIDVDVSSWSFNLIPTLATILLFLVLGIWWRKHRKKTIEGKFRMS